MKRWSTLLIWAFTSLNGDECSYEQVGVAYSSNEVVIVTKGLNVRLTSGDALRANEPIRMRSADDSSMYSVQLVTREEGYILFVHQLDTAGKVVKPMVISSSSSICENLPPKTENHFNQN